MTASRATAVPVYRETLWPPISWWLGGLAFCATCWWVIRVATTTGIAEVGALAIAVVVLAWLLSYGGVKLQVDAAGLRAGKAQLPWRYVGPVTSCTAAETKHLLGQGADARAFLLIRPYLACAVKVAVEDARDPAPYWLVSTRRPHQLADCLNARSMQD